jgi:hypothetical protein
VLGEGQLNQVGELAALRVESHGVTRRRLVLGPAGPVPERTSGVEVRVSCLPALRVAAGLAFSAAASEARRWVGSSRFPTLKRIARKIGIEEQ